MSFTAKNIYELLPAIYRIRDEEQDLPLKELIEVIAREAGVMENNIAELYENWFIETCKEWVVPYIGDLMGVRGLHSIKGSNVSSQRAYVANTISYRRRKGIAPVLEQLCLDVTGWRAHVTEFFEFLQASQYMNHNRLKCLLTPDLRKMNQLDLANGPFDTITHSADVRHISAGRGKYNIPNIGLFIWRIQAYPVIMSDARKVDCPPSSPLSPLDSPPDSSGKYFFTFNPLGCEAPLFNRPHTENNITHVSEEINVPGLLRIRNMYEELEGRRQALTDGTETAYEYFDDQLEIAGDETSRRHPVFEIFAGEHNKRVLPEQILICNLESGCPPPLMKQYIKQADGTIVNQPIAVVADPSSGRFVFTDKSIKQARVSYSYGFSGDLGAGIYKMPGSSTGYLESLGFPLAQIGWHAGISKTFNAVDGEFIYQKLNEAIMGWNYLVGHHPAGIVGVITVMDSCSYEETGLVEIKIPAKCRLLIIAANWQVRDTGGIKTRVAGDFVPGALRPHIRADISIAGPTVDYTSKTGGSLILNGLLVEGKLSVTDGNLGELAIAHCTIVPTKGGLEAGSGSPLGGDLSNQWLKLKIIKSITGPLLLNNTAAVSLDIEDSIIDNVNGWSISAFNIPTTIKASTVFGKTLVKTIFAENSIFNDMVEAVRRQTGCLRFCFAPLENIPKTPRRYYCQPDQEINSRIAELGITVDEPTRESIKNSITPWLVPSFRSARHCHYAYAQLSTNCPVQINAGADDGSEMGAFSFLKQPQRMANLRIALNEYLPIGLEAGFIFTT